MAPVCVASRLRLTRLFVIVLLLFMINQHAFTAFIYDRQILFDIRNSIKELIKQDLSKASICLPPDGSSIPESLHRLPCAFSGRKWCRRHGKRGGVSTRWKLYLASSVVPHSYPSLGSRLLWALYRWIRPVVPVLDSTLPQVQWGKKVFSQPPIVQVLPLKKMREACNFHHRYTSTMRDKIRKINPENHIVGFLKNLFASYGG